MKVRVSGKEKRGGRSHEPGPEPLPPTSRRVRACPTGTGRDPGLFVGEGRDPGLFAGEGRDSGLFAHRF